jgi:hypothetical protein
MCLPGWPIGPLLNERNAVPLWSMVMHGLIVLEARDGVS